MNHPWAEYGFKRDIDAMKDAVLVYEMNWGDNPPGFKEWIEDKMEKDYGRIQKLKRWLPIVLALAFLGLIFLLVR